MRRLTTAALTAGTVLLTLTACSSNADPKPPAPTTTAAPTTGAPDAEAAAQACTDAVYATIEDAKTGSTDIPKPAECATMDEAEYLQTVLAVLQQTNKGGQDDLQKAIEDAASAAAGTPTP